MKICLTCGHLFEGNDWICPNCGHTPTRRQSHPAFAPDIGGEAQSGFDARLFERLAQSEPGNYWFESRNRLIAWALERYFPEASTFLEIGCGTGFVLSGIAAHFPEMRLFGSEIYSEGLAYAAARAAGAAFFQMDARCIPFKEEFDVIGAFDVLEHIVEDEEVLFQMFRATKPGGGIILTAPQHHFLWSAADDYAHHQRRYTRKELVGKVVRVGFEVVRATSFVSALLPLMLVARIRPQKPGNCSLWAELDVPPALNRAFGKILSFERAIIQKGLSFPAGGSLLLVARRR